VRPDLGRGRLEIVPQVPPYQRAIAGRRIRVGRRSVDVIAGRRGRRYHTRVRARVRLRRLTIGHTLPAGARIARVRVDGHRVRYRLRTTNRGLELTARASPRRRHELVIRIR
jgi:hypothetical protein